jgi:hypothetical protein
MGNLINKTLTLGENEVELEVQVTGPDNYIYCDIKRFVGNGSSYGLAKKCFLNKVFEFKKKNGYEFCFVPGDVYPKRTLFYKGLKKFNFLFGEGPHICEGEVFFMDERPLEIGEEEFTILGKNISMRKFLDILKERGGVIKLKG